jgi:hypothetical protein
VTIREKALSPNHPNVARPPNNLAGFYTSYGRYADADPLVRSRSMAPCGRRAPVPAFEPSHNRIDGWQTIRQITKLQEIEQSIGSKNSQPSPRPVSAPPSRPGAGR